MLHTTRTVTTLTALCLRLPAAAALSLVLAWQHSAAGQTPTTNVALQGTDTTTVSEGVDMFTGKLEQVFPLLNVQGRGALSQGLYLPLRNSEWRVEPQFQNNTSDRTYAYFKAIQGNFVENYARAGYSTLGKLEVVTAYSHSYVTQSTSVTALIFTSSSGARTEFRDVLTSGEPFDVGSRGCGQSIYQPQTPPPACSRGRIFRATDGSNTVFVADSDIYDVIATDPYGPPPASPIHRRDVIPGTLYFADGTRVQVAGDYNNITRITDRNGNYMTLDYVTEPGYTVNFLRKITDSLNREVTITYGDTTQPSYFDEIAYKGHGGAERRIRVNYGPVETAMLAGESLGVPLFPGVHTQCWYTATGQPCDPGPLVGPYNNHFAVSLVVPTSVVLPNNTQYSFYYNRYLELARIKHPTGSYDDYVYAGVTGAGADGFMNSAATGGDVAIYYDWKIYRRVGAVRRSDAAGQLVYERTFSNIPAIVGSGSNITLVGDVTVETKGGGGAVLTRTRHYFDGFPNTFGASYPNAPMTFGKQLKTEVLDPATSAVLRRTEVTWEQREPFPWGGGGTSGPSAGPANDPRVTEVKTTLETGQVSKQTFGYDQYNNLTEAYEYDYGEGQPGPLLRRTHTEYVTDPNYTDYTSTYLLRLPLRSWVSSDLAGNVKTAFTQYEYDNYAAVANHAPLVPRGNVTGFDTNYHAGYVRRGNPTSATNFARAQDQTQPITSYAQFDVLGNVVKTIDPVGSVVTFDYADRFGGPNGEARGNWDTAPAPAQVAGLNTFAFPTAVTSSLGTTFSQSDYSSGAVVDVEDVNGNVATNFYADTLGRRTQAITANNRPALRRQQTFAYDDAGRKVTVTSDLFAFGDNLTKTEGLYDSLGQTTETRKYEAGGYIATEMEHDALGRIARASNPYRPHLSETPVWTTREYDALGRVSKVRTPDNSEVSSLYEGTVTTVTDQAGKQRRSVVNALGQLVRVDEPNDQSDLGPVGNPTRATAYKYDANGKLVTVTQEQQTRHFLYDSVGRLVRVRQPEQGVNAGLDLEDPLTANSQWSAGFTYDGNGNVLTTTDAKGTVITNTYDGLSRPLTSAYSDQTPTVTYTYDDPNVAFSKGRLTKVSSSVSTTEQTSFDAEGRVLAHKQTTGGQVYTTAYAYNLSGALTEETYPSGRVVKNAYDSDARLSEVAGKSAAQTAFQVYADGFAYTAAESVSQVRLGNGRWETTQFNSRLQVSQISLGSSPNAGDLWSVNYDYGEFDAGGNLQADKNSGSLARQTVNFAGLSQPYVQTYRYDSLHRLTEATELSGATQTWKQTFAYDRYGNRTGINQQKLGAQPVTQTPAVDAATNRFSAGQGFAYDPNGNVTQDNTGRRFVFNGDNRQVEVRDANNDVIGLYYYDGGGRRVKKVSAFETTVYVYDALGNLVAEYSTQINVSATSYLTADSLGSPRVITDAAGAVTARRDFMPFGEELTAGTAGRAAAAGYGNGIDHVRQRFTGYEKDAETGLDFAEARYYDDRYGRFTAVDPLLASGMSSDPQSFNRYAYVANNPLTATDPTGTFSDRDWYTVGADDMFQWFGEGPSIMRPIAYQEIIKRITTTKTVVEVRLKGGGTVVSEARVIITETVIDYINESGEVVKKGSYGATASAFDINNRPKAYTDLEKRTLEAVAVAIVEVSREMNFDPVVALAIAAYETHLGINKNTEGASYKQSHINPMQLSGGKARDARNRSEREALRFTIKGAIILFESTRGKTLHEKLRLNADQKIDTEEYARDIEAIIDRIRPSRIPTVVYEPVYNPFPRTYRLPRRRP